MLGLVNSLPLSFDSFGRILNRIEGLLSEILGSTMAARIMLTAPASPETLFRVARGGIAQERALTSALTSVADLVEAMFGVRSRDFSETKDDLGFNTGNTSAAYVFSEVTSETRGA